MRGRPRGLSLCLRCLSVEDNQLVCSSDLPGYMGDRGKGGTRNNNRIPLTRKLHRFDTRIMSAPAPGSCTLFDIPEEDGAVAAYAGEARIIRGHGDVEDGVTVCFVALDRSCGLCGIRVRIVGNRARKVD